MIDHDFFLDEFQKRGMRVDFPRRRVCFTEELIADLLQPNPDPARLAKTEFRPIQPFWIGGSFPKFYDWSTRKTLPGTTEILRDILRVFGSLPEFGKVGRVVSLTDVPQPIEPILATALVARHCPKPAGGEVYEASNIPYLVELGEIVTGKANCTDFVASCTFVIPPLKMTKAEGDMIIEKARFGMPAIAGTMPSSGATGPITREGTVALELAEVMGIWLCYRLLNPEIPLGSISASSCLDMKEASCSFSSPEAILQDCATVQILRIWFDADSRMANDYVDAKTPGIQTTYEKLFKTWWAFQCQGFAHLDVGMLEAGQTFCPGQAFLDADIWQTLKPFASPPPPVEEEIPFDDIQQVCLSNSSFLETDHTIRLFKDMMSMPQLLDRAPRRSDPEEARLADGLMDRAQARYDEAKLKSTEYEAPDAMHHEIDKVVARAKANLI